jgi:hypothetical protein
MNFYLLFFAVLLSSAFPSVSTWKKGNITAIENCQPIIDSANTFLQTSSFAVGLKPSKEDPERNLSLDKWFQKLSFKSYVCLLESTNASLRAFGFVYAAMLHTDSLLNGYSYLLNDTTGVQIFMENGTTSPKIELGEYLSKVTNQIKSDKSNFSKKPEIERKISWFIKEYATYPETYKPFSFPYFSMGSGREDPYNFQIHHDYEIKSNSQDIVRVINAFALDDKFNIHVIAKDSTNTTAAYPPKLEYWLKEFGRKLNHKDSLALRLIY